MPKFRRVRMYGNTWVIVLAPTDARDNKVNEKGWADIEDVIIRPDEDGDPLKLADENITKILKNLNKRRKN